MTLLRWIEIEVPRGIRKHTVARHNTKDATRDSLPQQKTPIGLLQLKLQALKHDVSKELRALLNSAHDQHTICNDVPPSLGPPTLQVPPQTPWA